MRIVTGMLVLFLLISSAWGQECPILDRLAKLEKIVKEQEQRLEKLETTPPVYGLWQGPHVIAPNFTPKDPNPYINCKWNPAIWATPESFDLDRSLEYITIKHGGTYLVNVIAQPWSSGSGNEALTDVVLCVNDVGKTMAHHVHLQGGNGNYFASAPIAMSFELKQDDKVSVRIYSVAWWDMNVKAGVPAPKTGEEDLRSLVKRPVNSHSGAQLSIVRLGPFKNTK